MKNCKKNIFFILAFLATIVSCSDITSSDEVFMYNEQTIQRNGNITTVSGIIIDDKNQFSERTVIPTLDMELFYKATAVDKRDAAKIIKGKVTSNPLKYSFDLPDGQWELKIEAYTEASFTNLLYEGKYIDSSGNEFIEITDLKTPSSISPIRLNPKEPSSLSGQGTFKVEIESEVSCRSDIDSFEIESAEPTIKVAKTAFSGTESVEKTNIPAGQYEVTFNFFKADKIVFSFTDFVYIYPSCTTNIWKSKYSFVKNNKIYLSKSLFSGEKKIIYVKSGSTNGTGSYFSPLSSIKAAIANIKENYTASNNYKIILLSDIQENEIEIDSPLKISISSMISIDDSLSTQYAIDASATEGQNIIVKKNAELYLENVKIKGGKTGIDLFGALVIGENVKITENMTTGATPKKCNVLVEDTGIIKIQSSIEGCEIGVSSQTTTKKIITSGYNLSSITKFKIDDEKSYSFMLESGEIAVIPKPSTQSGSIETADFDTVSLSLSSTKIESEKNVVYNGSAQIIQFYALLKQSSLVDISDDSKISNWDIKVFDGIFDITSRFTVDNKNHTLTIPIGMSNYVTFTVAVSVLYEKDGSNSKIPYKNTIFIKMID